MVSAIRTPPAGREPFQSRNRTESASRAENKPSRHDGLGTPDVPSDQIARTVLLADRLGYALAVIPKNRRIDLAALYQEFGRRLRIASREEAQQLFRGRPPLLPPPPGSASQFETFLEQSLVKLTRVFFETADLRRLVPIDGDAFRDLFYGAWCGQISRADD